MQVVEIMLSSFCHSFVPDLAKWSNPIRFRESIQTMLVSQSASAETASKKFQSVKVLLGKSFTR